jgi:hypothetical protein
MTVHLTVHLRAHPVSRVLREREANERGGGEQYGSESAVRQLVVVREEMMVVEGEAMAGLAGRLL